MDNRKGGGMARITIMEAGRTYPWLAHRRGDFGQWVANGLEVGEGDCRLVPAWDGGRLPDMDSLDGVVITGSHAMVTTREPWSERLADWLAGAVAGGIPVLGICFGHQLLAHALGGEVGFHPAGPEVGTVTVQSHPAARTDALFADLPPYFRAQAFHFQTVRTLPPGARLLAGNNFEPHHAFAYGESAWGVQFHPEFDAAVMRLYIATEAATLRGAARDPAALLAGVLETPVSAGLLKRFARLVAERF
jgi:GMP synthase (glutamine-hydrolysing)